MFVAFMPVPPCVFICKIFYKIRLGDEYLSLGIFQLNLEFNSYLHDHRISSLLVLCFILSGVLLLVDFICFLYVCLCVMLPTSRRESFVGAEDKKVTTES
jgi:hypothetical protein